MFRFAPGSVACSFLMLLTACGDSTGTGGSGAGTNDGAGTSQGGDGGQGNTVNDGGSGAGISDGGMTTTSLNGGGTTDGGGGEGGGAPMECASKVSNVPEGTCDLYLQNCPSNDDTCEIVDDPETAGFNPTTGCITRTGLKGVGQSCNNPEECSKKLTCVGNVCTPFCCEDDLDSCQGGDCNVNVNLLDENNMETEFHFQACSFSEACDLFTPDSCPANQNCYLGNPGEASCYTVYMPPENPDLGACDSLNECADSAVCVGDPGVCRYLCMINSDQPPGLGGCPEPQACDTNSFNTGFAGVGLCVGG